MQEIKLNEREQNIDYSMNIKIEQASVIEYKAKLIKKILMARQKLLNKGYDIGGSSLDLYNSLGYNFDDITSTDLLDLLEQIQTMPKRLKP